MPGKMARSASLTTVRAARRAGGRPHLAAVLQEGRKYANIHARSGVIWGIPVHSRQSSSYWDLSTQIGSFTVNRKQRRMAAKLGEQAVPPVAPGATVGPSVRIAELLATAQRHHQAGQLAEAEAYYRKILAIDQNHFDSLHLLGVIAHQVGRSDLAVDLIGKAIALNDRI